MNKITVTHATDSFFNETDGVNVKASIAKFCEMQVAEIREAFPGVEVEVSDENRLGTFVFVSFGTGTPTDNQYEQERDVQFFVDNSTDKLFSRGEWVVAE